MWKVDLDMGGALKRFEFREEDPSNYKKVKGYKGYIIAVNCYGDCAVFTSEEWSMGNGCRYPEWDGDSYFGCVQFINGLKGGK